MILHLYKRKIYNPLQLIVKDVKQLFFTLVNYKS